MAIDGVLVIGNSPAKMKGLFNDFVKADLQQTARDWHRNTMPRHFQLGAARRYKYTPRSPGYQRKKQKRGMLPALVWTGESEERLSRYFRVSGTKRRVTGSFDAPRYFWMTPPNHPIKSEELVAVTLPEATEMAKKLNERVTKKLNMIKATKVIR